jgi:hypothetical protein
MNDTEWNEFKTRLFIEYPSLHERLKRSATDYVGTLNHWRTKLSRFTFAELIAVLDYWDAKNTQPWDGFAVEQAVAVIANVASKARDRRNAKEQVEQIRSAGRKPRTMQDGAQVSAYESFDSPMAAAYEKLRPIHKRYKLGEISSTEYFLAKDEILGALTPCQKQHLLPAPTTP